MKKVSILMSMYNTPIEQLKQAVESMLNQTYRSFEFIIIDDCSKGDEVKTILDYNDDRIKLIKNKKNLGLPKSLNKGLKYVTTNYIFRMDTDDISHLDRIEKQMKFIEKNNYDLVCSRINYFDENGIYGCSKISGDITIDDMLFGTPFAHPSMFIKKDVLEAIGGYPCHNRCEDYAMELSLYAHGYKGYVMDDVLLDYRLDNDNYKKKKFKDRLIEVEMKKKYFKLNKVKFPKSLYIYKPILAGLIPSSIMKKYHEIKFRKEEN